MKTKDIQYLSLNQYAFPNKLRARWDLYESAIPKINIYKTGINNLKLKGNEDVLEVSCGDRNTLLNLRRSCHKGKLVGLEITNTMFKESLKRQINENLKPHIEFIVGSADNLLFTDASFNIILAFFMLYHMSDIQKTLREWKRVLKDDGQILIATGSKFNKPKHKIFKKMTESLIGKTIAPQLLSSFNLENTEEQLQNIFTIKDTFIYKGQIKIEKPELYMNAFNSTRDMYEPTPSDRDWEKAENAIRIEIEKEISQNGFFTDNVMRGFLICTKI